MRARRGAGGPCIHIGRPDRGHDIPFTVRRDVEQEVGALGVIRGAVRHASLGVRAHDLRVWAGVGAAQVDLVTAFERSGLRRGWVERGRAGSRIGNDVHLKLPIRNRADDDGHHPRANGVRVAEVDLHRGARRAARVLEAVVAVGGRVRGAVRKDGVPVEAGYSAVADGRPGHERRVSERGRGAVLHVEVGAGGLGRDLNPVHPAIELGAARVNRLQVKRATLESLRVAGVVVGFDLGEVRGVEPVERLLARDEKVHRVVLQVALAHGAVRVPVLDPGRR